jgi:hypothetical protein
LRHQDGDTLDGGQGLMKWDFRFPRKARNYSNPSGEVRINPQASFQIGIGNSEDLILNIHFNVTTIIIMMYSISLPLTVLASLALHAGTAAAIFECNADQHAFNPTTNKFGVHYTSIRDSSYANGQPWVSNAITACPH